MATTTSPADPLNRTLQTHRSSFKNTPSGLFQKHTRSQLAKTRLLFKPYTSCLMTSAVSERRSPPFRGATVAVSRCGARTLAVRTTEWSLGYTHPGSGKRATERPSLGRPQTERSGAQRGGLKPPVLGPRASDAGKCPHPGNPRRTAAAAAATRSGRQNGGGSDGLVLRGRARSSRPRVGPRWPAAAPRRVSPPCPIRNPERR